MNDDIAIKVDGVYKDFILPHERAGSVKGIFTSMFRQASVTKEKQHALKDISLEVKKGEFFGIVGRNGSGKSTLLKILAGIYQPTKGSVQIDGKLVPFIELGVGFNPELSGRDNVYLNGAMLGFSEKEMDKMYQEIVEFAELERFMDQKLKNYSSGMQVRLAFSMAIRSKAEILLLDEVLAVGDADFQRKCFEYFNKLKKENITVVFISHNMTAVREYCDRAILIEENRIIDSGKSDKVTQHYQRLFTQKTNKKIDTTSGKRWGDGAAKITKVTCALLNKAITVNIEAVSDGYLEGANIGFRIRDSSGAEILGTNTSIEEVVVMPMSKGKKINVSWQFNEALREGEYMVDASILYSNDTVVADWWNDSTRISIIKNKHSPYSQDPDFITKLG